MSLLQRFVDAAGCRGGKSLHLTPVVSVEIDRNRGSCELVNAWQLDVAEEFCAWGGCSKRGDLAVEGKGVSAV